MKDSQKLSILVTGGAGFVGTHLCRLLVQRGHAVTVIDLRQPETVIAGVNYVQGDVRNAELLDQLVSKVSTVYHLAATVSVPLCQKDPLDSYSNNFTSTLMVLEAIRRHSKPLDPIRLVFASTAAVYGANGDDGRALKEEDAATRFVSFYAAQKHASERAIELYGSCYGVPAVVFRFFNIFGPGQDPSSPYSGVITLFAKFAKEGKALPLNGGGIQTRDFISVYDIAGACADALDLPVAKWNALPMNLGSGRTITVRKLAEMIREISGASSEIISAPARDGDVIHSLADISRAAGVVGFKPGHELKAGLMQLLKQ